MVSFQVFSIIIANFCFYLMFINALAQLFWWLSVAFFFTIPRENVQESP